MIQEDNIKILELVSGVCKKLNATNSSKEKQEILKQIAFDLEHPLLDFDGPRMLRKALVFTYSPYITFGVTGESIRKWMEQDSGSGDLFAVDMFLWDLLESLAVRELTGHDALRTIANTIRSLSEDLKETFYNIIDKNLKIRMDAKSINKVLPDLIPVFEVSLCNVYEERKNKVDLNKDRWIASRKMDGVRCIVRIDENGHANAFSRQGKEFKTLDNLLKELEQYPELRGMVLDGECCIVDGNGDEDFKSIMKEITRKDHTIKHPMYQVFDMMTCEEFDKRSTDRTFIERLLSLNGFYHGGGHKFQYSRMTKQTIITSQEHFEELYKEALDKGWEGLVIRKDDKTICKRSDSMLKVKAFQDAEYIVEGIDVGPFRVIKDGLEVEEDVMTRAFITHKGNKVSVGSGWSLDQRRHFKEYPEELIGKTITVQYFEETTDKDGNISLRFPVCKYIYENGRNL